MNAKARASITAQDQAALRTVAKIMRVHCAPHLSEPDDFVVRIYNEDASGAKAVITTTVGELRRGATVADRLGNAG